MTGTGTSSSSGSTWGSANNYGDADDDTRYDDVADAKDNWNGCVVDRQQPYDVDDTEPSGNSATWFPAVNCDVAALLPLTTDLSAAQGMLDKMKASDPDRAKPLSAAYLEITATRTATLGGWIVPIPHVRRAAGSPSHVFEHAR